MRRLSPLLLSALVFSTACSRKPTGLNPQQVDSGTPSASAPPPIDPKRAKGPGFDGATAWVNTSRPITRADLRGRVTVVDFWTSCCINCIHTIPTLKKLEQEFEDDPFLVVGVHSPKFEAEQGAARLASNVKAYGIKHPVALDGNLAIWKKWGASSWPTVAVLDVDGRIIWADTGEPDYETVRKVVEKALAEGEKAKRLAKGKPSAWKADPGPTTPLAFPGKIALGEKGEFFVSDTGHNRIVWFNADGSTKATIGSGLAGKTTGDFGHASFRAPQGIAYSNGSLYVADTENHLIRKVDLSKRVVSRVAGMGSLSGRFLGNGASEAISTGLRSPWALLVHQGHLYVALAGSHQVGDVDLARGTIRRFAGSGRETRRDGDPDSAAFAQPSALATDGKELFVLDSETSSLRAVNFKTRQTRTLIGKGLFDFGDVDGDAERGRMQHPLGLAYAGGKLYIADTYNSKIKVVPVAGGSITTRYAPKGKAALFEPGGLAAARGKLWIADTHHHRVMRLTLAEKKPAHLVKLAGIPEPARGVALAKVDQNAKGKLDGTYNLNWRLKRAKNATLHLQWKAPRGTGINDDAPFRLRWTSSKGLSKKPADIQRTGKEIQDGVGIVISPDKASARSTLRGQLEAVICDNETHSVCVPIRYAVAAQVEWVTSGVQDKVLLPLPRAKK